MFDPDPTPAAKLAEFRCGDAAALVAAVPDRAVDLVFTSPPYSDARTYERGMPGGKKFKLRGQAWVDWLAPIVADCCRVSRGLVAVNMAGVVRQHKYEPTVEWLVADLTRSHGLVCGPSPYAWVKNGTPGSGGKKYHRRDWEPVYCFALPDRIPLAWADPLAFGHPPKYAPGGAFSSRTAGGNRVNRFGMTTGHDNGTRRANGGRREGGKPDGPRMETKRRPNGEMYEKRYDPPAVANPGNVCRIHVGGGNLGHKSAHDGEAPMPLALAERFVCWYVPPAGTVLDCFAGTGTTIHAAVIHGRMGLGFDIREGQVAIARRRLATVQAGFC